MITFLLGLLSLIPYGCDAIVGNVPMVAYGRVVDQSGAVVPGAAIGCTAFRASRFQLPLLFAGGGVVGWPVTANTGADGCFTIRAGRGQELAVRSIEKAHYTWCQLGPADFDYHDHPPLKRYRANPKHPVIFLMWNDTNKRIIARTLTWQVNPNDDNFWALEYATGIIDRSVAGSAEMKFRIIQPATHREGRFEWAIEVGGTIQGGIVESPGLFKEQAPDDGYVPALTFKMKTSDPAWAPRMTRRFYTKGQYSKIYAAVEFTAELGQGERPDTVTIKYIADFDGSPDLRPGPKSKS